MKDVYKLVRKQYYESGTTIPIMPKIFMYCKVVTSSYWAGEWTILSINEWSLP